MAHHNGQPASEWTSRTGCQTHALLFRMAGLRNCCKPRRAAPAHVCASCPPPSSVPACMQRASAAAYGTRGRACCRYTRHGQTEQGGAPCQRRRDFHDFNSRERVPGTERWHHYPDSLRARHLRNLPCLQQARPAPWRCRPAAGAPWPRLRCPRARRARPRATQSLSAGPAAALIESISENGHVFISTSFMSAPEGSAALTWQQAVAA